MDFERQFLKQIKENNYFDNHRKVLVALSGGLDSQTLFDLLYKFKDDLDINIGVIHINHGLRSESDVEEVSLREQMAELNVPFFVKKYPLDQGFSENKARRFRYDFFKKIMTEEGYTALVTGHHKDDQVETIFMRLVRGSRLRHLTGIKEVQSFANGQLIRPLLNFSKDDFTAKHYFDDHTNHENTYFRNRVRNDYLPKLETENMALKEALLSLSEEVGYALNIVKNQINELDIGKEKIDLKKFLDQSDDLQHFILQDYLDNFSDLQISKAKFTELLHIIRRDSQYNNHLAADYDFIKDTQYFYISNHQENIDKYVYSFDKPSKDNYKEVYIPKNSEVIVRSRQAGDRILVNGINKKVRRYFIDEKIDLFDRESAQILEVDGQIYAILGIVTSDLSKSLKNAKIKGTLYYFER
jgi:tRNA(Ile)-lysidine synthetase, N-terminal domain/tRNA(Ile)-lysidine synthetase, C-terminal domain